DLAPAIQTFLKALAMEKSLNFQEVEAERSKMIQALVKELNKTQLAGLVQFSLAYRLGRIRHTDFYVYLREICEKAGVRCKNYPAMDAYVKYVLLSDQINAEKLLSDLKTMEKRSYDRLSKIVKEKELIAESRRIYLIG